MSQALAGARYTAGRSWLVQQFAGTISGCFASQNHWQMHRDLLRTIPDPINQPCFLSICQREGDRLLDTGTLLPTPGGGCVRWPWSLLGFSG